MTLDRPRWRWSSGCRPAAACPTATATRPTARRPSGWCRSATPTASRARRATSGRSGRPGGAAPSPAGSAWTSSWSTSATTTAAGRRRGGAVRSGRRRRADRAGLGRRDRHHLLRDRHPDRPAGAAGLRRRGASRRRTRRDRPADVGQRAAAGRRRRRVVAAGAAVGLAAERYAVGRVVPRRRPRGGRAARRAPRPARRRCSTTDGVPLHVEVDEPAAGPRDAAGDRSCSATATRSTWTAGTTSGATSADLGSGWCSGTSAATAGRAAGRPSTSTIDQLGRDLASGARRRPRRTGPRGAGRPLDGRHDDHGAGRPAARAVRRPGRRRRPWWRPRRASWPRWPSACRRRPVARCSGVPRRGR